MEHALLFGESASLRVCVYLRWKYCIINIHFSGYETLWLCLVQQHLQHVRWQMGKPISSTNRRKKTPHNFFYLKSSNKNSPNKAVKPILSCKMWRRNMLLGSPCTVALLSAVQGGYWRKPAKYFKTAKVLVSSPYSFSSRWPPTAWNLLQKIWKIHSKKTYCKMHLENPHCLHWV